MSGSASTKSIAKPSPGISALTASSGGNAPGAHETGLAESFVTASGLESPRRSNSGDPSSADASPATNTVRAATQAPDGILIKLRLFITVYRYWGGGIMARINNDHRVGKVSSRFAAVTFQSFTGPKKLNKIHRISR